MTPVEEQAPLGSSCSVEESILQRWLPEIRELRDCLRKTREELKATKRKLAEKTTELERRDREKLAGDSKLRSEIETLHARNRKLEKETAILGKASNYRA